MCPCTLGHFNVFRDRKTHPSTWLVVHFIFLPKCCCQQERHLWELGKRLVMVLLNLRWFDLTNFAWIRKRCIRHQETSLTPIGRWIATGWVGFYLIAAVLMPGITCCTFSVDVNINAQTIRASILMERSSSCIVPAACPTELFDVNSLCSLPFAVLRAV